MKPTINIAVYQYLTVMLFSDYNGLSFYNFLSDTRSEGAGKSPAAPFGQRTFLGNQSAVSDVETLVSSLWTKTATAPFEDTVFMEYN